MVESFFTEVMTLADKRQLLSKEHFSVHGTLIQRLAGAVNSKMARRYGL